MNPQPAAPPSFLLKWVAMPIGGLALACFFLMRLLYAYHAVLLLSGGVTTSAVVTTGGLPREDSTYGFVIGSDGFHGRGPSRLNVGDTLDVKYLAARPEVNRPAEELYVDIAIGAAVIVLITAIIGWLLWRFHRHRRPRPAQADAGAPA